MSLVDSLPLRRTKDVKWCPCFIVVINERWYTLPCEPLVWITHLNKEVTEVFVVFDIPLTSTP
jgi:hypothetical protein